MLVMLTEGITDMQEKHACAQNKKLTFGLDIGIASVGWAVLEDRTISPEKSAGIIVDLGVRMFDAAEEGKTGEPLNLARRLARGMRRRLNRRVQRLKKLRRVLRDEGLFPDASEQHFLTQAQDKDLWTLRAEGLDRQLTASEWGRVLYHLTKHRGFYAARKTEESDDSKSEGGKLTAGVHRTKKLFEEKGYRSIGEMVARDEEFEQAKRNKAGSYKNSFYRKLLREELNLLFECQRKSGNPYTSETLQKRVDDLFWQQKEALSGKQMLRMVGLCTLEKTEYRLAKNTYTAERFVWLTRLNNLRISEYGERRALNEAERNLLLNLPYEQTTISYKQVRKLLDKHLGFNPEAKFNGLDYYRKGDKAEDEKLFLAQSFHELRKTYEKAGIASDWLKRSSEPKPVLSAFLDSVGVALSIYKTDSELREALQKLGCSDAESEALLSVSFSGFINLSRKALEKIVPLMEQGKRYDEACAAVGYQHSEFHSGGSEKFLPHIEYTDVRNPVVFRSLNQARKVVNALIEKYGSPYAIHIETARDLSKPFAERKKIEREQKEFADNRQASIKLFKEDFPHMGEPKPKDLLKYRMYKEQHGKSAYSLKPIDLSRLLEAHYVEVEHILPYSRSFDNSLNNKVLVLTKENQEKQNKTPYEYLDGKNQSDRWREFESWVQGNKSFRQAKRERLLRKDFGEKSEKEFSERNLVDTRYITRFLANFIKQHLKFAQFNDTENKTPVLTPAGGFTGFLRARWGLMKDRNESDRHHAMDACVIAAASHALIKRVSDFSRQKECLEIIYSGHVINKETGEVLHHQKTHFPEPWENFGEEVRARLKANVKDEISGITHYQEQDIQSVKPIWISRMPKRRNDGAVHQETIRSAKYLAEEKSTVRMPLANLKLSHLTPFKDSGKPNDDVMVGLDDPRNEGLVNVLRERLEAFGGDGKKAFAEPVYKPLVDGSNGPLIRTVKVFSVQKGGVAVRGGIADQASMWRVDVFEKGGKYFLIPIYQSDRKKGAELPSRAATQGKSRNQWVFVDESFTFRFSLCLNDAVRLETRDKIYFGYFAGLGVATATITIKSHDNNAAINNGKNWQGSWTSLGLKTGIISFEKYQVDVLGRIYPAKDEVRRGLA